MPKENLLLVFDDGDAKEKTPLRRHRPKMKAMLSIALAKAKTAVLLDNALNSDNAIENHAEACALLQQIMLRSSDVADRKRLSAVRKSYSDRIAELYDLDDPFAGLDSKDLFEDPPSDNTNGAFFRNNVETSAIDAPDQMHIPS
ncbi:hypothetical protein LTR84_003499 [Exophiala bonariae]|uniref:MIT domain-containing protein n=1 Tax=Exophiala bonariae TaxID=1690606 RepID=A0AAV9N722_9EURO|nr:hypothetical protein LTR84_003499 [Exophiala bonariae]